MAGWGHWGPWNGTKECEATARTRRNQDLPSPGRPSRGPREPREHRAVGQEDEGKQGADTPGRVDTWRRGLGSRELKMGAGRSRFQISDVPTEQ